MMNWLSHWLSGIDYRSVARLESSRFPGVRFSIRKVSLAQRIELAAQVRALTLRNEFLQAGAVTDQLEAAHADLLVEKLYLEWAVTEISGIRIDGQPASVALLIQNGPSSLAEEIGTAIRAELEFSDAERKNS